MDGLILATAMAGVILVVAGALRAGRLIALVPEAVIDGFTIGIATIIAASQFQDALGLSAGQVPADMIPKMQALWAVRSEERRVGKDCVRTCKSRWSPYNSKNTYTPTSNIHKQLQPIMT